MNAAIEVTVRPLRIVRCLLGWRAPGEVGTRRAQGCGHASCPGLIPCAVAQARPSIRPSLWCSERDQPQGGSHRAQLTWSAVQIDPIRTCLRAFSRLLRSLRLVVGVRVGGVIRESTIPESCPTAAGPAHHESDHCFLPGQPRSAFPGHPSAPIGARFPRGLRGIDNGCLGVIFRKKLTPVLSAG